MNGTSYNIEKELKSDKNAIKSMEPLLYEIKNRFNIEDEVFYNILIAVTEAINNAVFHGNKNKPGKKIFISIAVTDGVIEISIADEGDGFKHENLADPRKPENLLKSSGRGVFLIKQLAQSVDFITGKNGTTVKMKFIV